MGRTSRTKSRVIWTAVAAALLCPAAASAGQQGPPPPPTATDGRKVTMVAAGLPVPAQIAVAYGRIFVATPGDEQTGKGSGVYAVWRGKATRIDKGLAFGVVYHRGTLYVSGGNRVLAFSDWRQGKFHARRVVFSQPQADLPFLETMAMGPDGRLYVGSGDAGDEGAIGTALSGHVLAIPTDGSPHEDLAKGLRQPFGIGFVAGDPVPWVANESDESNPTPGDFIVHAVTGSDFGWPACQWVDPAAPACAGKTAPALLLPPHSSPTGMVGRGDTLYVAFFGGTTKAGPEIRALQPAASTSRRIVSSPLPLVGVGLGGRFLYFGDVGGSIYRVRVR